MRALRIRLALLAMVLALGLAAAPAASAHPQYLTSDPVHGDRLDVADPGEYLGL